MQVIIDRKMLIDQSGKIKTRNENTIESIQDQVSLYLEIIKNEVPFSDFGNTLIERIFKSISENEILDLASELVNDLRIFFDLDIADFNVIVEEDKIFLKLLMAGDYSIGVTINN